MDKQNNLLAEYRRPSMEIIHIGDSDIVWTSVGDLTDSDDKTITDQDWGD